jgi:excisionase family DNA binding protein
MLIRMQEATFLTTLDAAREAGVSAETIRLWVRLGRLNSIRTASGQRLFTREAIREALSAREAKRRAG